MLGMSIVFWSVSSRWSVKIIDENAFCKVKLQRSSVKRCPIFQPQNTRNTRNTRKRSSRRLCPASVVSVCSVVPCFSCFPWIPDLCRQERIRGRRAGVSGWPRLFHSIRATLQFLIPQSTLRSLLLPQLGYRRENDVKNQFSCHQNE
jgi:hypothetical protein